jgi:UDP-N-acetylglucosamine--N-acetylmuramyl-(pentapeptide) pyrophosphoryl-undecaprenol N-acetylglucosamine transferase
MAPPAARFAGRSGPLRILVVGGSLGAKALNDSLPAALALIPEASRPLVTHQSGKKNIDALHASYAQAGVQANVLAFIDDMAQAYSEADVVICRAGAITLSELTAAGVASVLVPFMASTTSHQRDNAQWMAKQNAAIHMPQAEMSAASVAALLETLSRDACLNMAEAAFAAGKRDANDAIAAVLEQLA